MNDGDIIGLVLKGQVEAYAFLVDKYKNLICDLCYKYTYDYNEAQDLSQEIFLKAYRKLDAFKGDSSFSTWLYRIGVNTCIDWARKNKKRSPTLSIDGDECIERLPSHNPSPEDEALEGEKRELIREAVIGLPEKYRTVVILYNYKNLSISEISTVLGIPLKTVQTRLYRAKKILKSKLLKPCNGGEYIWNAVE